MRRMWILLPLCLALLVTGCMDSSIIESKSDVAKLGEEARKTIVVWHTYSEEETRVFEEEVVPRFEQEHPRIRVESVRQSYNQEYQAALVARASANKTPDLVRMDYTWVPRFAHIGLLQPLNAFAGYDQVAGGLRERMLETNNYEGKTYGLPLNITTKAAIYSNKLLKAAGLKEAPQTVPEIVDIARKHDFIVGMNGIEMWQSLPYFFGLGGKLSDDGFTRTAGYLNSPESVKAIQTLVDLYKDGLLTPGMLNGTADLWNDLYAGNHVFMIDEGPWYYSILLNSPSLKVDVSQLTTPEPFPLSGQYRSVIGGESLVMTKGTKNKEEAWTFIQYMMRKDTQETMFKAGLIPTNLAAFEAKKASSGNYGYIEPYMKGIEEGYYMPRHPRWAEIYQIYMDRMEDIFLNGRDVKQALDEAAVQIDTILSESGR